MKDAIRIRSRRTPEQLRELRTALQLPADAIPEVVEAAVEHARAEATRRGQAEVFGMPFEPRPFIWHGANPGVTPERLRAALLPDSGRASKIAALIELQAKARAIAADLLRVLLRLLLLSPAEVFPERLLFSDF